MLLKILLPILMFSTPVFAEKTPEQQNRNIKVYNPETLELGLLGYDPVGYFPEGGNAAMKGSDLITYTYGGITYRFVSEDNKEMFISNPLKYEPTYGAWCAWAMVQGQPIRIEPKYFIIAGNRAHFFVAPRARANFATDILGFEEKADDEWFSISKETPRK